MEESGISTISEKEVNGTMMNMNNNKNRKIFVAVIAVILGTFYDCAGCGCSTDDLKNLRERL